LSGTTLTIDLKEYYLADADKLVGILVHIIGTGVREAPASLATSA